MENKTITKLWITNIKNLRLKKGWSQDKLARKADIPFTTFNKIETRVIKNPSIYTIAKIAGALEVTIDDLLYRKT